MPDNDKDVARNLQRKFYGDPQGLAQYMIRICLNQTGVVYEVFILLDNFSTLDVGCRFVSGCDVYALVKTNKGLSLCRKLYEWLTTIVLPVPKPIVCAGNAMTILSLKSAIDNAKPEPEKDEKKNGSQSDIPFAKLKDGSNIRLSPFVVEKLTKIAADYHAATGKSITVTDGNRTALEQAYLMIPQIEKGKFHIYSNKSAANEVKKVYDAGIAGKKPKAHIVKDIEKVIQAQVDRGIYLSRHLRDKGADIRFSDMTSAERKVFSQIVIKHGGDPLIEDDHFHLQF